MIGLADTSRGDYPDQKCSDCGVIGSVCLKHWGPLVPAGKVGYFDAQCWRARVDDYDQGKIPRPLNEAGPEQ